VRRRRRAGPGFAALIAGDGAVVARSDLRSTLGTVNHAVDAASTPGAAIAGWRADDERLVEAQGLVSQAASAQLARAFAAMPGVDERLRAGGAVLDVGAGAAGLGIALAAAYPSVHVVGIEPSQVAVAVGRRRIAEAGVADRVELRAHGGEALIDVDAYDLIYVAQMFMPDAVIDGVLAASVRALRPGGFLVTAAVCGPGDDVRAAIGRLRGEVWGGGARFAEDVVARLRAAGLPGAAVGPRPPGSQLWPVLGRRAR